MSKKDREGPSKRQEFREKRRRAEQRNRLITDWSCQYSLRWWLHSS